MPAAAQSPTPTDASLSPLYHEVWAKPGADGLPVLLIHGYTVRGDMFLPVRSALSEQHPLIVPDLRGGARSAHLPGPYTTAQHVKDLLVLLDQLQLPQVHVFGYSMGGLVAQALALQAPHRVRTITLGCTWAHKQGTLQELAQAYTIPVLIQTLGREKLAAMLTRRVMRDFYGFQDDSVYQWYQDVYATYANEVLHEASVDMFAFDSRRYLSRLRLPALILGGSDDRVVPPYHSQELGRLLPNAQLHLIPKGGHGLIFTHPQTLVHRLLPFWAQHP